jgi:hypothetical protein
MSKEILQKYHWINNSFFEKILKKELADSTVYVKTFEIQTVAGRDENYWCDVFKVTVNYVNSLNVGKSGRFVLKVGYYDSYMREELEKYNTFKRELSFYCDVLPNVEELMGSVGDSSCLVSRYLILTV